MRCGEGSFNASSKDVRRMLDMFWCTSEWTQQPNHIDSDWAHAVIQPWAFTRHTRARLNIALKQQHATQRTSGLHAGAHRLAQLLREPAWTLPDVWTVESRVQLGPFPTSRGWSPASPRGELSCRYASRGLCSGRRGLARRTRRIRTRAGTKTKARSSFLLALVSALVLTHRALPPSTSPPSSSSSSSPSSSSSSSSSSSPSSSSPSSPGEEESEGEEEETDETKRVPKQSRQGGENTDEAKDAKKQKQEQDAKKQPKRQHSEDTEEANDLKKRKQEDAAWKSGAICRGEMPPTSSRTWPSRWRRGT